MGGRFESSSSVSTIVKQGSRGGNMEACETNDSLARSRDNRFNVLFARSHESCARDARIPMVNRSETL